VSAEAEDEHEVEGVVTVEKGGRNRATGLEKKAICTLGAASAAREQFDGERAS
jgi:hypothetical protein